MILVTVGSLFPFDRLVRAADELARRTPSEAFVAQIGDGAYRPAHMRHTRLLARSEFMAALRQSRLMIAHAGMGSVLSAMELGKPIVLMPRLLERGEHNTDHQSATARWLQHRAGIHVCFDERQLEGSVSRALAGGAGAPIPSTAPGSTLQKLREIVAR